MKNFKRIALSCVLLVFSVLFFAYCEKEDDAPPNDNGNGNNMFVSDFDGNEYQFVQIGDQKWMKENLRTKSFANGEPIPYYDTADDWENSVGDENPGSISIPYEYVEGLHSDDEVFNTIGIYYNWHAVTDDRNICPEGWRVPYFEDWEQLVLNIDENIDTSGDIEIHNDDLEGFDYSFIFKGGFIDAWGAFLHTDYASEYWTLTESVDNEDAAVMVMFSNNEEENIMYLYHGTQLKSFGMTIRCVKDIQ